ncbi:MAG: GGDEF domain-containing protein, partial [Firmicutes bacterium]|nr:GGDEF domain-containing protein [Bacillota bacterium]
VLLIITLNLSKKMKEAANYDVLTGIYNRRHFMEAAASHVARSTRTGSGSFIAIFDLDHFKQINDTYGHLAGDKVLRETAQRVKRALRPYDVLGRYGGEEFIILASEIKKADMLNLCERIRLEICKKPVEFDQHQIHVAASFGVARMTPSYTDLDAAAKFADAALYRAKESGRNNVVFNEESES